MMDDLMDLPEDWPANPPELRQLDRSLRCAICQDFYTGPVVLVCGHSFCSRCIRDSLNVRLRDGQAQVCPSCRTACDQADLRPVTHLREASSAWRAVRQLLLAQHMHVQQEQQHNLCGQLQTAQQQQQQQQQQRLPLLEASKLRHSQQQQGLKRQAQPGTCAAARTRAAAHLRQQSNAAGCTQDDAITISSNCDAGQASEHGVSEESEGEVGAAENDSDPDWQADSQDEQPQRHPATRDDSSKRAAALLGGGAKRRHGSHSSSVDDKAGLSCSPRDAGSAGSADEDDGFEQQPGKRARSAHRTEAGTKQQHLEEQPSDSDLEPMTVPQQHQQPVQQQQQQPGYLACPICGLSVKEAFINTHVDSCLARAGGSELQHAARAPPATEQQQHAGTRKKQAVGSRTLQQAPAARGGSGAAGTLLGSARDSSGRRSRGRAAAVLEAPPKLCFELLKDRDLKAKLTSLGLSSEGAKKICVDRYTAFRNYVLSLKDSGTNNMSLAEAAADYTRQERRQARAAARPSSVGALVAAGANTAAAGSGAYSGAKVPAGSGGSAAAAKGRQEELAVVDHSYATLIQQTRARLESRKQQEQQQQQQGQEPQTIQQQSQEPQTNQQQQQQAQVLQARALEEKQLSCSEQPPQHRQGGSTAVTAGQQQAAVCGVQRQGDSAQLAGCSGRTKQLQPSPWGSAPESAHQQQTGQLPSTILPDSDGEL